MVTSGEVRCEHRSSYARSSPPLRPLLPRRCYLPPSGDSAQHCATSPTYIATSDTCRGFYTQSALVEGGQHPRNSEFHRFDGVGEGEPSRDGKREPQPPNPGGKTPNSGRNTGRDAAPKSSIKSRRLSRFPRPDDQRNVPKEEKSRSLAVWRKTPGLGSGIWVRPGHPETGRVWVRSPAGRRESV